MAYDKAKMKCPYCGTEMSINGMTQHVRFKHPEKYEDFKSNKAAYVDKGKVADDAPEPEVQEPVEPEEPAAVSVEADADEPFQEDEPEFFQIRQVKKDEPEPKPDKPKRKQRKSTKKQEPKPETKRRRYGFFNRRG